MLDELLKSRKSCRNFRDQEVSNDRLNKILNTATRAPTPGNLQTYCTITTRDADRKKQLASIFFRSEVVQKAPVIVTFCLDWRRIERWSQICKVDRSYNNLWSVMMGVADVCTYAQTVALLAESKSLGTCFLGTPLCRPIPLIDFLECPRGVLPVISLALGYPEEICNTSKSPRIDVKYLSHAEAYREHSDVQIIEAYKEKDKSDLEAFRKIIPESEKIENWSVARIISELKYSKNDTNDYSKNLIHTLSKQGFMENNIKN